jgi:VWFA-related protein
MARRVSFGTVIVLALAAVARLPAQDRQTFRSGVDLVQVDVSVLDRDRRPIRGLTIADFTLLEDGRPQRLVAFNPIDIPDHAPDAAAAPWLRDVAPDVRENVVPEGRLFTIVMDDAGVPPDAWMVEHTRAIARGVVDRLRPGDLASVIFTSTNQHAQELTDDRARLLRAIETFRVGPGPTCGNGDPRTTMNVLYRLVDDLATAPQRLKSVIVISVQPVVLSTPKEGISYIKRELYRRARFANVSIYPIDPAGLGMEGLMLARQCGLARGSALQMHTSAMNRLTFLSRRQEVLYELASNTGGRTVVNNNEAPARLDDIFEENASYYVLGYESPGRGDRYRRIEVKVNRPGVTVRSRNMWRPQQELPAGAPPGQRSAHAMTGILPVADVPMRIALAAFAAPGRSTATVAMAIGVRETPPAARTSETISLVIGAFTPQGEPLVTERHEATLALRPIPGRSAELDLLASLDLKPGRYSIRVGAHSRFSARDGSVYADVEVPDFGKAPLALSGIVLSADPAPLAAPRDRFAGLLPVVPTTRRTFTREDAVTAFLRVYQRGRGPAGGVSVLASIVNSAGDVVTTRVVKLEPSRFDENSAADFRYDLPLRQLEPGEYLLGIDATVGGRRERREVRFVLR